MTSLVGLLLVPVVIGSAAYIIYKHTITWKEFVAQVVGCAVMIGICFGIARFSALRDVEHWNGRVSDKDNGTEGCCHSYECNCQTCTDAKGNSYDCNCQTCYEHFEDYWWQLDFSTGDRIHDGCNGWDITPGWWDKAYVGEPASLPHGYTNYLKADPESIIVHSYDERMVSEVPPFPQVRGKYHVNKVIEHHGAHAPRFWEPKLMDLNADLGNKKQVDVTILLTGVRNPDFAYAVEAAWLYGPKNSLNIVMGTDGTTILWARVVTISEVEELKIELRDGLTGRELRDPQMIDFIGEQVAKKFKRTPMEKYSYLASAAAPSGGVMIFLYILAFLMSGGISYWMHREDVFGDQRWLLRNKS